MKKINKFLLVFIPVILIVGCVVGYYFYYLNLHFFKTDNAAVSADSVPITPLLTGNVSQWNVKEGDTVTKGELLGRQDLGNILSSSAINVSALSSSADSNLSKADIKSPIDGKVVQSNVVQGETISPGMQIAIIADTSNMYITANIEETSIFKVKTGQKADVNIDAYWGKRFTGYVQSIGQASQSAFSSMPSFNTSGTFSKVTQLIPVKITIVNDENLPLLLGMNATVNIHLTD